MKLAFGTIVGEIKEVSRSYKEARMALDVGKIFLSEKDVIPYNELGIGRLIYQLPLPLCRMFIQEIFGGRKTASSVTTAKTARPKMRSQRARCSGVNQNSSAEDI